MSPVEWRYYVCGSRSQARSFFHYSYPNFIPLPAPVVDRIVDVVMPLSFDRIDGHFFDLEIEFDAKLVVQRSAERYKRAIGSFG